jgi:Xaa-Pro aminopeptidase
MAGAKVIEDAGYGKYFGHGIGHGVGIEIHEEPFENPRNEVGMPAGAVVTAEPGIYIPGKFGIRTEDMLFLTADGNENLTKAPK